uniref:Midasin n=1 Tax=Romanomermis culicivorax TaxID=13658 RepID=A0A915IPR7_ROMCU
MEIKGWEFLLDDAECEHENSALISVLKFHLVVKSFIDGGIDHTTLLTAYSNLLSFCPLGEFHTRLEASKIVAKVLLSENRYVLSYLINLNAYFECFATKISDQKANLRLPIEKELKDFIKIVKFQDLNVYRAKETGRHAHRQLFKMVRSYREALQDPVAKHMNIALTVPQEIIDDCRSSICPKVLDHDINFSANNQHLVALISYISKFNQFSSKLISQLSNDRCFREINDDLCQTALEFGSEIRKNINYGYVKEENLKLYKRNKQKRTNLLVDLFESLRLNGFRYREGVSIVNQKLDALIFEFDGSKSICGRTVQRFDRLFWYCIQRKNIFDRISGQKLHDQIDGNISQRCVGYVKLFIKMLTNFRANLQNWDMMIENVSKYETLFQISSPENCSIDFFELQSRGRKILTTLSDLGRNLSYKLDRTSDIWNCNIGLNKENFNLNPIINRSPILTFLDHKDGRFSNHLSTLKKISSDVKDLQENIAEIEDSSKRVDGYLSLENFEKINGICSKLKSVETPLKILLDISSNPYSADANFYNTYLIECLDLIGNFNSAGLLLIDSESMLRNNDDLAENLANKLYFVVQELWKVLDDKSGIKDSDDTIVGKLNECKMLSRVFSFEKVLQLSNKLMEECRANCSSINPFIRSIFTNYSTVCKTFSTRCFSMYVELSILFLGIIESWMHLLKENGHYRSILFSKTFFSRKKGFVKEVPDLDADDQNKLKNGGEKFEDTENAGMGDGRGAKDVSDDIDDLGQVEGLKKKDNNENLDPEEDEKMENVDKPLEIEDDFEASLEDLALNDEEEKSENGHDEKDEQMNEPDWQKGEAENPENNQLDPKMWNDREEEQNSTLDDETEGAKDAQEDMVAKDHNRIPEKENEEKAELSELEVDDKEQLLPDNEDDVENIDLSEMIDRDGSDEEEEEESSSAKNAGTDEDMETEKEKDGEVDKDFINPEDQQPFVEDEAQPTTDQKPSNEAQTIKQSGGSDRNDDQNLNEKNQQEIENQLSDDITKEGLDSEKNDTARNEKEDDGGKSGRSFAKKRSSREDETNERSSENHKKQKVDESNKTLAVENQQKEMIEKSREICEIGDLDDVIEIDDDTTYTHQPNLNSTEKVKQVLDSTSLDIAKEQVAQKEKDSEMDIDVVEENEEDSTRKDRKEKEAPKYNGTAIDHESSTSLEEDSADDIIILGEYKPSTIHTCLDFYNQASTSKMFENEMLQYFDNKSDTNPGESNQQNKVLWAKYALWTQALASELSENLRLTLEPTLATKYQGDYRTGKRLNIRKLVPYIASFYRKNKIWLRRTKKAKRDYQIMLAIDDSSSMNDNKTKQLAFESLALMSNALRYLESGQLAVCKFGEQTHLLHPFDRQFDDDEGAWTLSHLTFEQKATNIIPIKSFNNYDSPVVMGGNFNMTVDENLRQIRW